MAATPRSERGEVGSIPAPGAEAQVRQRAERLGLNPSECGFKSHPGYSDNAEYANRQSGQAQTLVIDCGFDSRLCDWNTRRLGIGEPKWL